MSQQSLALFNNAELALAAYATLAQGATAAKIVNLVAEGMSFKQANEFSTRYPIIITQFNDTAAEGAQIWQIWDQTR